MKDETWKREEKRKERKVSEEWKREEAHHTKEGMKESRVRKWRNRLLLAYALKEGMNNGKGGR